MKHSKRCEISVKIILSELSNKWNDHLLIAYLFISYLAQVPVSSEFRNELVINQGLLEQMYNLQPGNSLVTFNGYILSQDLDMYEILDLARREMGVMTKLHDFGLQVALLLIYTCTLLMSARN